MSTNTLDKEKILLKRIEKAKGDLAKLQKKRKLEIGELAVKSGLGDFDISTLKTSFEKLAKELQK